MTLCASPSAAVLCLLLAVPVAFSADKKAVQDSEALISYSAPHRQVLLTRDLRLADTEELAEYANPVSDAPSKVVTVEKSTHVTPEEAAELLRLLRETTDFSALKDAYGAGPKERSYPYIIRIRDGRQDKQVVFRSSPDAQLKPKAFATAEGIIIEFARKAVEINPGE